MSRKNNNCIIVINFYILVPKTSYCLLVYLIALPQMCRMARLLCINILPPITQFYDKHGYMASYLWSGACCSLYRRQEHRLLLRLVHCDGCCCWWWCWCCFGGGNGGGCLACSPSLIPASTTLSDPNLPPPNPITSTHTSDHIFACIPTRQ